MVGNRVCKGGERENNGGKSLTQKGAVKAVTEKK